MLRRSVAAMLTGACVLVGCNAILDVPERHLARQEPSGDGGGANGGSPPADDCLADATDVRTGYVQVDGLLDVAEAMADQLDQVESDFQAAILVMAASLGIATPDGYTSEVVDAVIAGLGAEADEFTEHGVSIFIPEVRCSADIVRALEQQNACEADSGCDGERAATQVECQGLCRGVCGARCDACREPIDGRCMGSCIGACALKVAQACSGQCQGTCSGTCVALDQNGDCQGDCDGDCGGTCVFYERGGCGDTCTGECETIVNGKCPAGSECAGTCDSLLPDGQATCAGDCIGRAIPVPGDPQCELGKLCKLQSSLLGTMRMSCDSPQIVEAHTLKAGLSKAQSTQFESRLATIIGGSSNLLVGLATMEIIAAGSLVSRPLVDPPPYDLTYNALKDMADRAERQQPIPGVPPECSGALSSYLAPVVENLVTIKQRGTALVGDQLKYTLALQAGFR